MEEEEEKEKEVFHENNPRKLDFNAPILTTRQPMGTNTKLKLQSRTNSQITSCDACNRIPFSWEQIPGKPKDMEIFDTSDFEVPTPKLPPGRRKQSREGSNPISQVMLCHACNGISLPTARIPGKPKDMETVDTPDYEVSTPKLLPGRWNQGSNAGSQVAWCNVCNGIPFSRERIPGRLKGIEIPGMQKLPPGRWNQSKEASDGISQEPFPRKKIPGKPEDIEIPGKLKFVPGRWNQSKETMSTVSEAASCDASNRMQFSREKIPGKVKDIELTENQISGTPKLPSGRQNRLKESFNEGITNKQGRDYEDGCDADVEDDYLDDDGSIISYAIDIFSLGESSCSMDMVDEPQEKADHQHQQQLQSSGSHSSEDFIIKRFLPDARALAASSLITASNFIEKSDANRVDKKSCGLNFFFPWRMKPRPCGGKRTLQATTPPRMALRCHFDSNVSSSEKYK